MKCQRCESERIIEINAKCSQCCHIESKASGSSGYVPEDIGLGDDEDYINFKLCLDCGQHQGGWPLRKAAVEYSTVNKLKNCSVLIVEGDKTYEVVFKRIENSDAIQVTNLDSGKVRFFTGTNKQEECAEFVNCRPGDLDW